MSFLGKKHVVASLERNKWRQATGYCFRGPATREEAGSDTGLSFAAYISFPHDHLVPVPFGDWWSQHVSRIFETLHPLYDLIIHGPRLTCGMHFICEGSALTDPFQYVCTRTIFFSFRTPHIIWLGLCWPWCWHLATKDFYIGYWWGIDFLTWERSLRYFDKTESRFRSE